MILTRFSVLPCSHLWTLAIVLAVSAAGCEDIVPPAEKFAPEFGGPDIGSDVDENDAADAGAAVDGEAPLDAGNDGCADADECVAKFNAADTCRKWVCVSSKCAQAKVSAADKVACDDGDACTESDLCGDDKCEAGTPKSCDDDKPCTANACEPKTGDCKHPDITDGEKCDDAKTCITSGTCAAGTCKGEPCDDGSPCTDDSCDAATAKCSHKPTATVNVACEDGDPCTGKDFCKDGKCEAGGADNCKCKTDADCGDDDANLCNGTTYCDKTNEIWDCAANPASQPFCSPINNTDCLHNACVKTDGSCKMVPPAQAVAKNCDQANPKKVCWFEYDSSKTNKASCDDGDPCTSNICDAGKCVVDSLQCGACTKSSDCKDDGDLCNGTPFCNQTSGKCETNAATVVTCPTSKNTECAVNTCVEKTQANNQKVAVCEMTATTGEFIKCDDNNPCTVGDTCDGTSCKPGTFTCKCKQDSDCASYDDKKICNGVFFCDKSGEQPTCAINPKTVVVCDTSDDTECKSTICNEKNAKCEQQFTNVFKPCDADNNPCTKDDACDGKGVCEIGTNTCDCKENADCAGSDDLNACNGTLYCDKGSVPTKCKVNPATVVKCATDTGTVCKADECDTKTGKCAVVSKDGQPCTDGQECTVGDKCAAGACKPGTETCACKADSDCIDDGDLCNGTPYCDASSGKGVCANNPATVVKPCDATKDGGCAKNLCNKLTGACQMTDDGSCDDSNGCTVDACDLKTEKCVHTAVSDGTACSGGTCTAGQCKP